MILAFDINIMSFYFGTMSYFFNLNLIVFMPHIIFSSMATLVVHHITQICEIYSFVRILELLGEW